MKVYVKVLSGRMICVKVGERRLVESVKNQIMEKLNIPTNTDTELYRAKSATGELELMESDKTMKHYGIRPGVTLYLDRTISVRVRMITGDRSMSISIQTSHSIQEVKTKIQEQLGILPENQRLIFSGKLVKDNGTVRDYKIKNDDQIFVIRRVCQCNLLIKDSHSGQDLPVKVEPSYTVEQVKLIIGKVKGVPIQQQQLTFHNTLLDNSKTLKHYDIGSGSQLVLDVCQYIPGQIFIRTLAGKTITLDVSSSDTVEKVKSMIECKEGIPPSHQKLMFMGKQLRDGTLNACGVQNETTVDLFLCVSGGRKMEIYVKIMGVNTMTVEVETSNKVKELKSKIYKLNGISPDRQLLILAGTVLDDNQTLDDYNIQRESTLHLFVSDPKGEKTVCITVKTHTGKEICFNETINKSIEHLMSTIEEMEGIPKDCQRLFFNGELLDYRKLLSDYRFSGANVVYLEFSGQIQVFVEILSCVSSATVNRFVKKICLRVVKEMKVSSLKCLIEYREKIPVYSQTLLYGYKVMDDRKLLGDYNIQHWCILQLSLEKLHHAELEIRVETPSEPLDLLKLDMDTTIQEVKRSSRYLMDNCSIEEQCLYYGGTLLHNDKLLRDYMVTDGSVLHLLPPREFPVFVHATIKGAFTNVFIGVKTTDTIKAIKNRILGKANIPLENCLYLSSMLLVDSKTVGEYRITAACTLNSVCPGEIPIYIKTRFTSISFGVKPSKPIGTIMEKISHSPEMGVPQRLLFHQQLLTGNVVLQKKLISDLHISAGSTLTMVMPNEIDIYVCTPWGSTLTLVCHKDDKIRDVKGAIEEIEGIAVENQILPFSNDEKTLKEENVECRSLSVVPLKADIDQQQKYEHAIILQEKLKLEAELESKRKQEYVYEMQLESASDYMQRKKAKYEEQLAEQAKEMQRLKEELQSAIKDSTDSGWDDELYREFIYRGEEEKLQYRGYGIYMHFPKQDMEREVNVTVMSLKISSDDCSLPDNAEIVSGVYRICVSETLPSPVTVEIKHCVQLLDSDAASTMSFVHSNSEQDPPYQFKVLEGGQFPPNTCYGKIKLSHFSDIGIVEFLKHPLRHTCFYSTNVFKRESVPGEYEVHIVVTEDKPDHNTHIKEGSDYKSWSLIAEPEIDFEDHIGVDIPEAKNAFPSLEQKSRSGSSSCYGLPLIRKCKMCSSGEGKVSPQGWKMTTQQKPAKITNTSVKRYAPGRRIPHIPLRVRWESEQKSPVRDELTVNLTGTKGPASFVIVCNTKEQVDLTKFTLIKYDDGMGEKELRIKEEIGLKWKDLAMQLGFKSARIETLAQSHTPTHDMMTDWLQKDPQHSWKKLIEKLNDAGLKALATDLKCALCYMMD